MRHGLRLLALASLLGVALLGVTLLGAPPAHAHGGSFQGPPKPPLPPPIRTPPDIAPPPTMPVGPGPSIPTTPTVAPPPPTVGPGGGGPTTPSTKPAPTGPNVPSTPTVAPGGLPLPTAPGTGTGVPPWIRGRRTAAKYAPAEGWSTWWRLNRWAYLPTRVEGFERDLDAITPSGGDPTAPRDRWEQRRRILARTVAVPTLLGHLDPKARTDDEVRAAALIALARTAHDKRHVEIIQAHAGDKRHAVVIRESAALALGLLRRTAPERPLDALGFDALRRFLIAYFDDDENPTRARALAMISVGLLSDQPYATAFTKDGRLVTHLLWERLSVRWSHPEMPVAVLTALGMQPAAGVPEKVREGLQQIALGKRVNGVNWTPLSRSHALAARLKIGGSATTALLLRILPSRRVPREVKEAAWIGLAGACAEFSSKERMTMFGAFQRAYPRISDPVMRGMAQLALARLIETDLAEKPDSQLLYQNMGPAFLLKEARVSTGETRGFAALALGLAAHNTRAGSRAGLAFRRDATALARKMFEHDARAVHVRGAYAIALGLLQVDSTAGIIAKTVGDRRARPENRAHCGDALALLRVDTPEVRAALKAALSDRRAGDVRGSAATAWAALAFGQGGALLVDALQEARTQREVGHVAVAIANLGDLSTARTLVAMARDPAHLDENRALALTALGLLLDPELRPSLIRLRLDANYTARTSALHEAFDIL